MLLQVAKLKEYRLELVDVYFEGPAEGLDRQDASQEMTIIFVAFRTHTFLSRHRMMTNKMIFHFFRSPPVDISSH
jgi:hypothetical protein